MDKSHSTSTELEPQVPAEALALLGKENIMAHPSQLHSVTGMMLSMRIGCLTSMRATKGN